MDIRSWALHQIMQLPDNCFGRRFLVSCCVAAGAGVAAWDISELAFPERAVIWEFGMTNVGTTQELDSFRLALGDVLPTSTAIMDALEPVFPGLGLTGLSPRQIYTGWISPMHLSRLRFPIMASGRRLVFEATGLADKTPLVTVMLLVSSIPVEVPDCLFSA